MPKRYDLAVKIGQYQDRNGNTKGRYENIGEIHDGKEGGMYATISPYRMLGICHAALARGEDRVMVSMFEPRDEQRERGDTRPNNGNGNSRQGFRQPPPAGNFDDELPFMRRHFLEG